MNTGKHPCERVYEIGGNGMIYGNTRGICRITGKQAEGLNFENWVKGTFNDWAYLQPGTIISNAALFCFDEKSEIIKQKTGKDKLQRFRTYSHIIYKNEWYCVTKANKKQIFDFICAGVDIVSLTETGQKHIYFKHRMGFWQLDEVFIQPDIPLFQQLHTDMCDLMRLGFSQTEVISGEYQQYKISKVGLRLWHDSEQKIKPYRFQPIFDFAGWMLFVSEEEKQATQDKYYTKTETPTIKTKQEIQTTLF